MQISENNAPHELYIEQVKQEEKKKKRRYLLLLLLLLLIGVAGGGGLFSLLRSPEGLEYRTFNKTDLDAEKVRALLAEKNVRLRVLDYERGRLDTINTLEEYKQLYGDGFSGDLTTSDSSGSSFGIEPDAYANRTDESDPNDLSNQRNDLEQYSDGNRSSGADGFEESTGPLKRYKLDIIGKKVAGEILSFIITDYNPSIKYNLDFGNGIVQDAKEITLYMYPASGRFTLNLTATDAQFNRSITNEYLEIKPQNSSIADNQNNRNGDNSGSGEPITSNWEEVRPENNTNTNTGTDFSREEKPDGSDNNPDLNSNNSATDNSNNKTEVEQPRSTTPTEQPDTKTQPTFDATKIKQPLTTAQKAPSFPGGTQSMYSFLNKHIAYPQQARDFEVEGKVYVQFEVDRAGTIKHPKVVRGLGYGCDEEALRIVKLMPKWEPAEHMNQVVPYLYTLPVTFRLVD